MSQTPAQAKPAIEYPSTDGEPMAQNTKRFPLSNTNWGAK